MPSAEYQALQSMRKPDRSKAGDMWIYRRLGIIRVMNGHKRGSRRGTVCNSFHLYHWGEATLYAHPCDWRDNDMSAGIHDPALTEEANWEYLGNIFDLLPYESLAGEQFQRN